MKIRRFRAYGEREDLQAIFEEFQNKLGIYYVPTYSDIGEIIYQSITDIKEVGINFHGSHIGNMQMLIFLENTKCHWRTYQYKNDAEHEITRYTVLDAGNSGYICIDLNGIYNENAIFPTTISSMHYDNDSVKRMFDELKKIFRKQAIKTVNGAYICPKAYEHRARYRFCTINIKSPPEYDLDVK